MYWTLARHYSNFMTMMLNLTELREVLWSICDECGMQAEDAFLSGHLVPSLFWNCNCYNCYETIFSKSVVILKTFSFQKSLSTSSILLQRKAIHFLVTKRINFIFKSGCYRVEKQTEICNQMLSSSEPNKMQLKSQLFKSKVPSNLLYFLTLCYIFGCQNGWEKENIIIMPWCPSFAYIITHLQNSSCIISTWKTHTRLNKLQKKLNSLMVHKMLHYLIKNEEVYREKRKEIWLSPVTKTPISTENSKTNGQHNKATKTSITQRLRTDLQNKNNLNNCFIPYQSDLFMECGRMNCG